MTKKQTLIASSVSIALILGLVGFVNRENIINSLFGSPESSNSAEEKDSLRDRIGSRIGDIFDKSSDDKSDDKDSDSDKKDKDSKNPNDNKPQKSKNTDSKNSKVAKKNPKKPATKPDDQKPKPKPSQPAPPCNYPSEVNNLYTVWSINLLPDCSMLIGQRDGVLVRTSPSQATYTVSAVQGSLGGEAGLMGVTIHPNYKSNGYVYLYYSTNVGGPITNVIERVRLSGNSLVDRTTIVGGIPSHRWHAGGAIAFGPDGKLYVTTGDLTQRTTVPQNTNSLAGKILRFNADGSIPSDNPFGNAVYSYGHRNPQGLVWDNTGRLWSTEHGPSGDDIEGDGVLVYGRDELNIIQKGKNYGWPHAYGERPHAGTVPPTLHSGTSTWAPAGIVHVNGKLYFTGLAGQALYEVSNINSSTPTLERHLHGVYGRLRAITVHGDSLYVGTSAQQPGADRVVKIPLSSL